MHEKRQSPVSSSGDRKQMRNDVTAAAKATARVIDKSAGHWHASHRQRRS